MSTHAVKIIELAAVTPHANAERLEIVPIGGWQAVTRKGQFKGGDRAIYIEPDYLVPTKHPAFSFLAKDGKEAHRLKAVRLRGALSYGLLIEVPEALSHLPVGTNVIEELGIKRYEAPTGPMSSGADKYGLEQDLWPKLYCPKFDLENIQNHLDVIQPGEQVVITEKVDGGNARYVWHNDQLYMGSRNRWLKNEGQHFWAKALANCPAIETWCKANPDTILFGEVFGHVQALRYGRPAGHVEFIGFAALRGDTWIWHDDLFASLDAAEVPRVPVLYRGPFDMGVMQAKAEQDSPVAIGTNSHMMEGVVVVPVVERRDPDIGRVAFKYISSRYWESN